MMPTMTPAYGRDYKTAKAALADWNAGKDWIIADIAHPASGRYANKEQLTGERVMLRFDGLRKVAVVK
jgi:hypothetical protein